MNTDWKLMSITAIVILPVVLSSFIGNTVFRIGLSVVAYGLSVFFVYALTAREVD